MENNTTKKIMSRIKKVPARDNYHITSFTVLKDDHIKFLKVCKLLNKSQSELLREFVLLLIEENLKNED